MSKMHSREAKAYRHLTKFLRQQTYEHNKLHYRKDQNGNIEPYTLPYRDFLKEYEDGTLIVEERKRNEFHMRKGIDYLKSVILGEIAQKRSRMQIEREGVIYYGPSTQRPKS